MPNRWQDMYAYDPAAGLDADDMEYLLGSCDAMTSHCPQFLHHCTLTSHDASLFLLILIRVSEEFTIIANIYVL